MGKTTHSLCVFQYPFAPRSLVSPDSSRKIFLLFLSLLRILSGAMNFYSETKFSSAGEREVLLQKQQKRAAKFSLSPWYSELLALISARANNNTSCTKAFISPGEKSSILRAGKTQMFPILQKI